MFAGDQGSWLVMAATTLLTVFVSSWVYNLFLLAGGDAMQKYKCVSLHQVCSRGSALGFSSGVFWPKMNRTSTAVAPPCGRRGEGSVTRGRTCTGRVANLLLQTTPTSGLCSCRLLRVQCVLTCLTGHRV